MRILSDQELDAVEASHPELKAGCPTCRGAGTYLWQHATHLCDCKQQKRLYTLYAQAGIGLAYQRLSWSDLGIDPDQIRPVMQYLDKLDDYVAAGIGLYLPGTVGSGKTTLLNLILKEAVRRDYDCYSTTFVGAIDEFAATWRDDAEKRKFASRFEFTKILGIDDVGKEYPNKLAGHTLDRILRVRDQEDRPSLVTTNLSAEQAHAGYGGPVLSLLVGRSIEVPLKGEDYRIKARARKVAEI